MGIFDRFLSVVQGQESEDASQEQREALVDLLVLTMFVDHHSALAEREALDKRAAKLEWQSVRSLSDFLAESIARARKVIDDAEKQAAYLGEISERLGTVGSRERALSACRDLVGADGRLKEEEILLLRNIQHLFSRATH